MKTKNNVQKTVSRLAAVMVIAGMSLTTLDANATAGKSSAASKAKKMMFSTILQEAADAALPLEPWMISSDYFTAPRSGLKNISPVSELAVYTAYEKPAQIENWMTDDTFWKVRK